MSSQPKRLTIKQGDCFHSIAWQNGHLWQTVWEHESNAKLREKRDSPNILEPGDVIFIPEIKPRNERCDTEKKHRFKRKGSTVMLKLRFVGPPMLTDEVENNDDDELPPDEIDHDEPDDEINGSSEPLEDEPRKNTVCVIKGQGFSIDSETDNDGCIEIAIPVRLETVQVHLGSPPNEEIYNVVIGGVDPLDTLTGIQQRLVNLGYFVGPVDGLEGPQTQAAIKQFRVDHSLVADGGIDAELRDKLFQSGGS